MNLYKIHVEHFSQKDSHKSVEVFLLAEDGEAVYNWIDREREWGGWTDYNDEDGESIGGETFKEKMIRIGGEFYDEDLELCDLYYGKTLYGWESMPKEMMSTRVAALKGLGMLEEVNPMNDILGGSMQEVCN